MANTRHKPKEMVPKPQQVDVYGLKGPFSSQVLVSTYL